MTFLPIVERELRVAARLTATYRNRSLVAGVVALVALFSLLFGSFGGSTSVMGGLMFKVLSYLTLFFCLQEGARKTADCLSEEKREGTLGLLFLTDLRGYDIVLGKLAAMSLSSFYGLFAILPVLALPLLLGGVLAGEFWRMALALLNILFVSLCVGISVSAASREEHRAMGAAFLIMLALALLPLPMALHPLSPVYAFHTAFQAYYFADPGGYWKSLGIGQLFSWSLLVWASFVTPRSWRGMESGSGPTRRGRAWFCWPRTDATLARLRAEALDLNPILWLVGRRRDARFGLMIFAAIAVLLALIFILKRDLVLINYYLGACWALNLGLKAWMAVQACRCHAEARRNNALEMLLVTPLTPSKIINGQIEGLRRLVLPPVFFILAIEAFGLLFGSAFGVSTAGGTSPEDAASWTVLGGTLYLGMFSLDMVALAWTGMWFGLSSKKESQAVTKTVLAVLVVPYLFLILSCLGAPFFIGSSIFLIFWSKNRLERRFREIATQRYGFQAPDAPLWSGRINRRVPPPLPSIQG